MHLRSGPDAISLQVGTGECACVRLVQPLVGLRLCQEGAAMGGCSCVRCSHRGLRYFEVGAVTGGFALEVASMSALLYGAALSCHMPRDASAMATHRFCGCH